MLIKAGAPDVTTYVVLLNSLTDEPITGATITDIKISYTRARAALSGPASLTALDGVAVIHADNKGIEVDSTNAPGLYRIDWPDAAFAVNAASVVLTVSYTHSGVTAYTEHVLVELNAPVDAVAVSGDANTVSNLAAVKAKTDNLPADPASNTQVNTRMATFTYTAPANSDITAIKAKTDNLPATPASQGDVTGAPAALLATALSQSPTADTVGEALLAALANAKNKLVIAGDTMTLYKANGTTPLFAWTLNSTTHPTVRTPTP